MMFHAAARCLSGLLNNLINRGHAINVGTTFVAIFMERVRLLISVASSVLIPIFFTPPSHKHAKHSVDTPPRGVQELAPGCVSQAVHGESEKGIKVGSDGRCPILVSIQRKHAVCLCATPQPPNFLAISKKSYRASLSTVFSGAALGRGEEGPTGLRQRAGSKLLHFLCWREHVARTWGRGEEKS